MTALLGRKIEHFDPQQEERPQYVERLEQFFKANDLAGDKATKRRATFCRLLVWSPINYIFGSSHAY